MTEPPRLTSRMLVDALRRQIQQKGGFVTVLQRGNDGAGAVLLEYMDRGEVSAVLEKNTDFEGVTGWRRVALPDAAPAQWVEDYRRKRTQSDPDLWWLELDIADAARFADELLAQR